MSASDSKMIALVTRLVETSRRHAPALALAIIGAVALLGALALISFIPELSLGLVGWLH